LIASRDEAVYKEYKATRNEVKTKMAKLLTQEQEKISVACKQNPKLLWQYINKRTKSKTNVGDLRWSKPNGTELLAENDSQKAAALQDVFSSVYTLEKNDSFEGLPSRIETNIKPPLDLVLTSECIYNKFVKLNFDKSPEPDHLHLRISYKTRDVIAYPLSLMFSKSVESGILPGDWKLAEVTAIYKIGPKHDRGNYRLHLDYCSSVWAPY